jgi:antirestriction protein ArdC/phage/plasmid primase-like uncharacterized protein
MSAYKDQPGSDYAREVADAIIDQLRKGTAPWTKPWEAGQSPITPHNPTTGKEYRGANAVWLMVEGQRRGYEDTRWMTFRQANEHGGAVRRGEKGTRIQYWLWSGEEPVIDKETGKAKTDEKGELVRERVQYQRPRIFTAVVFNAHQIDGLPPPEKRPVLAEWERHQRAEAILATSGADLRHVSGDRAYYDLPADHIVLPERTQFKTADGYYETALHELSHWTGHASRLNRALEGKEFGSEAYAREELRAELASFMLGDRLGIGHDPSRHASYVASWIKSLQEDPREIFKAAADAEKISGFIRAFDRTEERSSEDKAATTPITDKSLEALPVLKEQEAPVSLHRTTLAVPYAERTEAKAAGARWDRFAKVWYAREGTDMAPLARWSPKEQTLDAPRTVDTAGQTKVAVETSADRTFLAVPYAEKDAAKTLGARWDKAARSWFVPPGVDLAAFTKWIPAPNKSVDAPGQDPFAEFGQALKTAGLELGDERPKMDGEWHRVPVEGDKRGEKSGAYRGYLDGHPAGYIENHKAGEKTNWKSQQASPQLSDADRARLTAEAAQHRLDRAAAREVQYATAAGVAKGKWEAAVPVITHPYLEAKNVPAHGVRQDQQGNLLVPLYDAKQQQIASLQTITPNGRKSFEKGGRVAGTMFRIDLEPAAKQNATTLIIAEGYATAATVARATGLPTFCAFNAGNLSHVATELRAQHPQAMLCIAADNDHCAAAAGRANVGRTKAEAAARAVGGHVLLPEFKPGEKGSDWNDAEKLAGPTAVRQALESGLAAAHLVDQVRKELDGQTPAHAAPEVRALAEHRDPKANDLRWYGSWDGR